MLQSREQSLIVDFHLVFRFCGVPDHIIFSVWDKDNMTDDFLGSQTIR